MPSVPINKSTTTSAELVAAPGEGKFIRVMGFSYEVDPDQENSNTVTFLSAATVKHAPTWPAGGGEARDAGPDGIFDCAPNEALNMSLSAAIAVKGSLTYVVKG